MASAVVTDDNRAFGQLVRRRRHALGLSQEALAAAALGNPDRKTFISAIENNRLTKITPSTAMRLSHPLGLAREDVPAALRWPTADGAAPLEQRLQALEARQMAGPSEIEDQAIARFLNARMDALLRRSMSEVYRDRLVRGLDLLQVWTGRPFSRQSLLICYALSLLYVIVAGLGSFLHGDIAIGDVRLFRAHVWASASMKLLFPILGFLLVTAGLILCWMLVRPFGLRPMRENEVAARLGGVALTAGVACGVADYLGSATLTVALLFTVPSCAGISTLGPRRGTFYGAVGGILLGLVAAASSAWTDDTALAVLTSLSEGFFIGGIVGSCAGLSSTLIARRLSDLRPRQLAGAGGGVAVGALVSLAGIVAADPTAAISPATLGLFAVSWIALPFANAALDYLSLGVSHALGRALEASGARALAVFCVLVVDLILAVLLMVLTPVGVALTLSGVTWALGIETQALAYLEMSAGDPWGQGLWLTLMVFSTTLWTWLHFGLVIAPLAAGAVTRSLLERPAARRLDQMRQAYDLDMSIGVLLVLRIILFYLVWAVLALSPAMVIFTFPEIVERILWIGHHAAGLLV